MAPIKSLVKLERLCLEQVCLMIIDFTSKCLKYNISIENQQFQKLSWYIKSYIPINLHGELFHKILKKLALYKGTDVISAEIVIFLMKNLVSEETRTLSFSDLIYAGGVDYEVLDSFELGLGDVFRYFPKLTYIDLSTHRNETSLPSSSYKILNSIGWHCPNLRFLNLNNNNRITDDCIYCLSSSDFRVGCPNLEEIYLQECNTTDDVFLWLLKTFPKLKKIGCGKMGLILEDYFYSFRNRRNVQRLRLKEIDNTESISSRSDGELIDLINRICPTAENVRLRVSDEDCRELYKLKHLTKLELKFYTGNNHRIGHHTMDYLRDMGRYLNCLTITCDDLYSEHVIAIMTFCKRLKKLFLYCGTFQISQEFDYMLKHSLKVLIIRIGHHEMDECPNAAPLVRYLLESESKLEEIFLLLICKAANSLFFDGILSTGKFSRLKKFIYDAPKRFSGGNLPVIPINTDTTWNFIESCPKLETIGNLISWQVPNNDIVELKAEARSRNYNINIINSIHNKISHKCYF